MTDREARHPHRPIVAVLVALGSAGGGSDTGTGSSGGSSDEYTCRAQRVGNNTIYVTKDEYGNVRTFDSVLDCY